MKAASYPASLYWASGLLWAGGVLWLLWLGQEILKPLMVAVFLLLVVEAFAAMLTRFANKIGPNRFVKLAFARPRLLALALLLLCLWAIGEILLANISSFRSSLGDFQLRLDQKTEQIGMWLGIESIPSWQEIQILIKNQLNLRQIFTALMQGFGDVAGNLLTIFLLMLFVFLEEASLKQKLVKIAEHRGDKANSARWLSAIDSINKLTQTYLATKIFTSLITAIASYGVLLAFGLDFPAFWALLIFLLNFIPYIGSLLAVVGLVLFGLIAIDSLWVVAVMGVLLTAIQLIVGNFVEPRLMGRSMNLSPLAILLGLALFGTIWGVVGMFLSVPLLALGMVLTAQFESTRPIAIILSAHGNIEGLIRD